MSMLIIGLGLGVFFFPDQSDTAENSESRSDKDEEPYDHVPRQQSAPIDPEPDPDRVSKPDTLINTSPGLRRSPGTGTIKEVADKVANPRMVVLIKRFPDLNNAVLLQKHFSRWQMQIIETDDKERPYWNCVFVRTAAEGRSKIREWNRHSDDFDHLGLELKIMQIEM